MRVSGPIDRHRIAEERFRRSVDRQGEVRDTFTSTQVPLIDGQLDVRMTPTGLRAVIERSLPTLAYGHNLDPVSVRTAVRLVSDLYGQAAEFVDWGVDVHDLRITRLDLDRDFAEVAHLDRVLRGLARIHVPRTANPSIYGDSKGGGSILTLTRQSPKRWRASLYDKHAQVLHLARQERDPTRCKRLDGLARTARGRVRFEVQLRSQALKEKGVRTVSDLNEASLLNVRKHYFQRAGFDNPVGGAPQVDEVMTRLATSASPDYGFFGAVLAMLKAEALGLPQPTTSPNTLRKYRALARQWGLSAADMACATGPTVVLDYESGRLRSAR
ncbi:phage/plasmid replication domain-containing protein [Pedococcus sp. 5OH_020]|uniref:phage/plasmid replication domain-containing protein n=1 Tax=Pedococcus sp. 5OH_020 TaxID=2989814 RepID=UPI0022E9F5E2|nr:phage/plasmid replication protein [Pedococcus sp. 5OH_020]